MTAESTPSGLIRAVKDGGQSTNAGGPFTDYQLVFWSTIVAFTLVLLSGVRAGVLPLPW